jgi:hypothetical protein
MNRRQVLALAAAATVMGILFPFTRSNTALAADPVIDTLVAVARNDGTVVRGKIVSYDRDKLTLAVSARPKDPPVNTDILWSDIKKVSNGLTREKALQKWKGEHHDALCATCHGNSKIFCPTCHGTAHDPASSADCPKCKGAAQIVCTTIRCDHGTIPCPNPSCLKLTDGGWYKKPDGTRWKRFSSPDGWYEWSEHHLGQVVVMVNGKWENHGACPVCGGATTIGDPVCLATGEIPCPVCAKKTANPPCPDKCDAGLVECPTCKGSGLKA